MSVETHHARALLEEAQLTLDRVHRAALAANAGELRRGLDLAVSALREAGSAGLGAEADQAIGTVQATLEAARTDLDGGALVEMEKLIETARNSLAKL
jgi:hypothetical protein